MSLRKSLLEQRKALSSSEIQVLSARVFERFSKAVPLKPDFWSGKRVALYRAMPGELTLDPLAQALQAAGASLHFPRLTDDRQGLQMVHVDSPLPGVTWTVGHYGIEEPPAEFMAVDPTMLDVVWVPGVAFGPSGERMGMGAGYYDRFLTLSHRALRIAFAFDFQLLKQLEQNPWDQPMDWIWTEQREFRSPKATTWISCRKA